MGLKTDGIQKYLDPLRVRQLAFKNTAEVLEAAIIDYNFITGPELLKIFHKAIISNPRSNQDNDLVVDPDRLVVKTYEAMDASRETDFVVQFVEPEAREDVAREKRLEQLSRPAGELVILFDPQLGCQSFYSPSHQIIASAIFLFRMSMDHVPAKRVSVYTWHDCYFRNFVGLYAKLPHVEPINLIRLNFLAAAEEVKGQAVEPVSSMSYSV